MASDPVRENHGGTKAKHAYRMFRYLAVTSLIILCLLPATHHAVKVPMLALLAAAGLIFRLTGVVTAPGWRPAVCVTALVVITSLGHIAHGAIDGAPGWLFSMGIYVVWPLVFLSWTWIFADRSIGNRLAAALLVATILVSLVHIAYITDMTHSIAASWIYRQIIGEQAQFTSYGGYTRIWSNGIASLIFLGPYVLARFLIEATICRVKIRVVILYALVALLAVGAILVSGRRALVFGLGVAAGVAFLAVLVRPDTLQHRVIVAIRLLLSLGGLSIGGVLLVSTLGIDLSAVSAYVATGFSAGSDYGAQERIGQIDVLLRGWLESPIIGHGLGSYASGWIRSEERPWEYEVQYAMLLFQTGLLGLTVYALGPIVTLLRGLELVRSSRPEDFSLCVGLLAGLAGALVVNGTNPYLQAYGNLWMLFLPYFVFASMPRLRIAGVPARNLGRLP